MMRFGKETVSTWCGEHSGNCRMLRGRETLNNLQMLGEVHLIRSDGEELNCMLLCTKKHVTSAVSTRYYNVLYVNWEGIMVRTSQHFDTVCKQE